MMAAAMARMVMAILAFMMLLLNRGCLAAVAVVYG